MVVSDGYESLADHRGVPAHDVYKTHSAKAVRLPGYDHRADELQNASYRSHNHLWVRRQPRGISVQTWWKKRIVFFLLLGLLFIVTAPDLVARLSGTASTPSTTRFAFATYISDDAKIESLSSYDGVDNPYFDAARLINYQLRHSPATRIRPDIDVVVLVSQNVSLGGRQRLAGEGARVIVSEPLTPDWVKAETLQRYGTTMDKLTLAQLSEYEKLCFIDADTVIRDRLDGIFEDPATEVRTSIPKPDGDITVNGPPPRQYMFAAIEDPLSGLHDGEDYTYFNAGFFCWHPSTELFDYYMRFLHRANSFAPVYPEQNLVSHRRAS